MKNRIITLMCVIAFGTSVLFAESGVCGDNLTWTFENGVLYISGYGGMRNYNYHGPWEPLSNNINKIVISKGVTSIGRSAFDDCSNLTSVTIPYGVTSIGSFAFSDCSSLTSIEIPNSVTSIGDRAFKDCNNLTSITIPYSITSIGDNAFEGCASLTSVAILNEEIRAGDDIFISCESLQKIIYPKRLDLSRVGIPTKTRKIEFVFLKAQSRLAPYKSTSPKAESNMQNSYVDLDLPSKTLWKTQNERDLYSFDRAVESFRNKLPTKEQWQELRNSCEWVWNNNGYQIIGRNGNSIFLSAKGFADCTGQRGDWPGGPSGNYWSSTQDDDKRPYGILFNKNEIFQRRDAACTEKSICLVRPNHFVDLGLPSGTLWSDDNEEEVLEDEDGMTYEQAKENYGSYLPTKEQWQELIDECTWIWVEPGEWNYYEEMEMYEHEGDLPFYIVIGKNGNTITLPAEGYIKETTCYGCGFFGGVYGLYCSSSETKDKAFYVMDFNESEQKLYKYDSEDRNDIYSIRLVYK